MSDIPSPEWLGIFTNDPDNVLFDGARKAGSPIRHQNLLVPDRHNRRISNVRSRFLKVGDVINRVWVGAYQHGATMIVTKVNAKSIGAVEIKGSYGAGTVWRINNFPQFAFEDPAYRLELSYMTTERINEIVSQWHATGV